MKTKIQTVTPKYDYMWMSTLKTPATVQIIIFMDLQNFAFYFCLLRMKLKIYKEVSVEQLKDKAKQFARKTVLPFGKSGHLIQAKAKCDLCIS